LYDLCLIQIFPVDSHRPKKSLGQHYLRDENIARKIVESLLAEGTNQIIEIGPGHGILTSYLFARNEYSVLAIEIDHNNVEFLRKEFPGREDQIVHYDFLEYDLSGFDRPVALIGNFPYNISSQIFFRVLENRNRISEVVCMIQKEVADRLSAGPGTKTYGILSVLLQAYYKIEYLFKVTPKVFFPQPKVYSAVIRLTRNSVSELECDESLFFRVVKACFNQRRKTIKNSVRKITVKSLPQIDIMLKRPEQLNVEQFVELTQIIQRLPV
jgi:16S rRNA (adenine1518-N6/adenine1519-N6)-dimethyltransferase